MSVKNRQLCVRLFVFCSDGTPYYTPALFVCLPAARGALHPAMTMKLWWWTMSTRSASPRSASYRQMLECKRRTHTRHVSSGLLSRWSESHLHFHWYVLFRIQVFLVISCWCIKLLGGWTCVICWQDRLHSLCSAVTCLRGSLWDGCPGKQQLLLEWNGFIRDGGKYTGAISVCGSKEKHQGLEGEVNHYRELRFCCRHGFVFNF